MRTVCVDLPGRAYDISIGEGLLDDPTHFELIKSRRVAVVTNETIAPLYLDRLTKTLARAGIEAISIILPDGERYKEWETLNRIFDALLASHCERSTPLLALGGGVVGDMTGFAAACYQRGAPFYQVPTTLLAQVDSSVGGKTAINHPRGKNMIGAFYQPQKVVIDLKTLDTLPDREFNAGMAEVIKYGLIRDAAFFEWIEQNAVAIKDKSPAALATLVATSCEHKAAVVLADEREQGLRATLNLGHTFGHAIEAGMGYGQWLHGEAVSAGSMMAAEVSVLMGWMSRDQLQRMEALFLKFGLPTLGPKHLGVERYLDLMAHDKKVVDGALRLVLLKAIGVAVVTDEAPASLICQAIAQRTGAG